MSIVSILPWFEYSFGDEDNEQDEPSDQEGDAKGWSHLLPSGIFGNQMLSSSTDGSSGNKFEAGDNRLSIMLILRNKSLSSF